LKVPVINSLNDLVDVPEEVELLVDSSFSPQEIVVRLKQEISKMYKHFFFFSSIQKVIILLFGFRRTQLIPSFGIFYKNWGWFRRRTAVINYLEKF
tara:strand:- start:20 stop:307 length:288 start_codon:yes stop_codon:yes gene_type:complete